MMRVFKALLLSSVLVLPLAQTGFAQSAPPATISVTGEGSVDGVPDLAVLSLGVTTQAETAAQAMADNTAALAGVLERLKASGVADRDMQTSNLSLNPVWSDYNSNGGQPKMTGYTASNQLTVRIRALDGLGQVLDAAISDGANTLNGLSFGLSDPRPAMDEARVEAVGDARAKATLLVEAAGARLGKIISISEGGGYAQPAPMFKAEMSDAAAVPVAGGEVSTTANVMVVFEIMQ